MFGYVRPRRDLLDQREFEAYHRAYCGLCKALGKGYGFRARFLVNYDMTFLYLLRATLREPAEAAFCWCPARVFGRKACTKDADGFAPVAACTVILSYEKLRDNLRDEGLLRSLPYRVLWALYRRPYRRAVRCFPEFAALCEAQLSTLRQLEEANSPSIDAAADAFARIVSGCVGDFQTPSLRRPVEQILYHTGRFLYLADALDDLKEDCRKNAYNPLRFRFAPIDGALNQEDLTYLTELIDGSVNLAGAAMNLLPSGPYGGLLENIVYLGFPAVFSAVKAGSFQARASLWREKRHHIDDTGESK